MTTLEGPPTPVPPAPARSRLEAWEDAITEYPGSTRGVSLMRIGIALVAWAEFGGEVGPRDAGWGIGLFYYAATTLMVIGFYSRAATFAAAVAMWTVIQRVPGAMHHHTYLMAMCTTCLALTPCGGSFSLDRWLAVRAAKAEGEAPPPESGNLWAIRLIQLQLSALFFWGGYNKLTLGTQALHSEFFTGDRLEQTLLYYHSLPVHGPNWISVGFALLGTSVVVFELFTGFGLWFPKTRMWCLLGCLLMTTSFQILLNVRTFGLLAAVLYVSFVPPERVHRLVDDLFASPA